MTVPRAGAGAADRTRIEQIIATTGEFLWVDEEPHLDAVTALSGSGPAYVFLFLEAMIEAGAQMGLTREQAKVKREEEIVAKEKAVQELKRGYFGPEGELYKKRQSLMKPIQDEIYTAVQELSKEKDLQFVFDKSSDASIIFTSPKIDISDAVLQKLGYSK